MQLIYQEITDPAGLKDCLAVRRAVFIEEQQVPADREVDGLDGTARHFAARDGQQAVAACRIRLIDYDGKKTAKIERVAVLKPLRGKGIGRELMKFVLQKLTATGDIQVLKLSSQTDAVPFYEKLGFEKKGAEYIDAGIPHIDMVRDLTKRT